MTRHISNLDILLTNNMQTLTTISIWFDLVRLLVWGIFMSRQSQTRCNAMTTVVNFTAAYLPFAMGHSRYYLVT